MRGTSLIRVKHSTKDTLTELKKCGKTYDKVIEESLKQLKRGGFTDED